MRRWRDLGVVTEGKLLVGDGEVPMDPELAQAAKIIDEFGEACRKLGLEYLVVLLDSQETRRRMDDPAENEVMMAIDSTLDVTKYQLMVLVRLVKDAIYQNFQERDAQVKQ